jgi:lipopolysaccharide export system permease protein
VIYVNTLSIARVWVERGFVPDWLGTWWVHGLLAALTLVMLAKQSGIGVRVPRRATPAHEPAR